MRYCVKISPAAQADIRRIFVYTEEKWGEQQAIKMTQLIQNSVMQVQEFPLLATKTDKSGVYIKRIAKLPLGLVYQVSADQVKILQLLHDKQDRF